MKKYLLSLMTLLLAFTGVARADELTVNDGTSTNGYVPVYGFYADAYLKAEYVIPAVDLAEMDGAEINGMTFYATQTSVNWGVANFQVFMTEVDDTTINAFQGTDGATVVYEGALSIENGEMIVTFTTPYTYNGGNLLVGFYNTVEGSYVSSTWYGVSATGASVQGYSYSSLDAVNPSQRNFLPKTTFNYELASTCDGPTNLMVSEIRPHQAFLTWDGGTGNFNVEYKKASDTEWIRYATNCGWNCVLTDLDRNTTYRARVQSNCEDGSTSSWRTITFVTREACPAPTNLQIAEGSLTANGVTMTWDAEEGEYFQYAMLTGTFYDPTTVTWGQEEINNSPTWINLNPDTDYTFFVRRWCDNIDQSDAIFMNFTTPVSCPAPWNLTLVELTATSATLTWEPGGDETEWKLVRTTDGGTIEGITDNTYTIQGLTPNVVNSWAVVAVCGEGEESAQSNTVTFEPTDKVVIGSGTSTNQFLPTYTYYNYSLTQQIYTAEEIGLFGEISSIDFYNTGAARNRSIDIYMVNTSKTSFNSNSDWITVTADDLVFSDTLTFVSGQWTTIELTEPFNYDGSNLAIIVDDNTGSYVSAPAFYAFSATNQAIRIYNDYSNYDPMDPPTGSGAVLNMKNQIRLGIEGDPIVFHSVTLSAEPDYGGSVSGGGNFGEGSNVTITATPSYGYTFQYWEGGTGTYITENPYTFTVTEDVEFVAHFEELPLYEVTLLVNPENYGYTQGGGLYYLGDTIGISAYPMSNLYQFVQWTDTLGNVISEDSYYVFGVAGNVTYVANFEPINTELAVNPDTLDLGYRPSGAWMRPYTFTLTNFGYPVEIESVETNEDYFTVNMGNLTAPFTLDYNQSVTLGMEWGEGTGVVNADFIVNYDDTEAAFPVTATAYAPVAGDVWETAIEVTEFPYTATLDAANAPYYNNYVMPYPNIPDGYDVVYKLVFDQDTYLNASVLEDATAITNGKVALYPEGFKGLGGPDERNNYTNPMSAVSAAPFEAMIGDENSQSTSGYFPFYTLYNYSIAENLFLAEELQEAGVTTAPMTSLSWCANNAPGYLQQGISIWMANVNDYEVTYESPLATSMTLVYTGAMTPEVGWNEFFFNENNFAWDGSSNVLILCQRNNGSWNSTVQWLSHNTDFYSRSYTYRDGTPYDAETTQYGMNISNLRANIIMKSEQGRAEIGGNRATVPVTFNMADSYGDGWNGNYLNVSATDGTEESITLSNGSTGSETLYIEGGAHVTLTWTSGSWANETSFEVVLNDEIIFSGNYNDLPFEFDIPTSITNHPIVDMTVVPGTYYLVASATTENFTVNIETSEVPCPEEPTLVAPEYPFLDANPYRTQLKWKLDDRATEYALRLGTDPDNLETIVDWTDTLMQSYTARNLNYNTTYFWQVCQRNDGCTEGVEGPIWRFTTDLTGPTDLYSVNGNEIMEGDVLQLAWTAPVQTTRDFMYYKLYRISTNGYGYIIDSIGSTTETYYELEGLEYIGDSYCFAVHALYNINMGNYTTNFESSSNDLYIYVIGESTVEGHVYEQDGTTGIADASVTIFGYDEFGYYKTYNFTTDENGAFEAEMPYGASYSAFANTGGYQEAWYDGAFAVMPDSITSGINIIMDELFWPVQNVVAQYYPDADAYDGDAVQVNWTYFAPDANTYTFENGMEGWTTIDADGDGWNWMLGTDVMSSVQGHNGSNDFVLSQSWNNTAGVLYPDNYLVSPQVELGGQLHFFACAQDINYAAEHFGVAVSTSSSTNPEDFTMLQEWTMSAKSSSPKNAASPITTAENATKGHSRGGNTRAQGTWYEYTVDLSAYSGMGYVAIRHFNCSDMFYLDVDDINIYTPSEDGDRSFQYYRVYRTTYDNNGPYKPNNTTLVADNVTETSIIDETFGDLEMGTYKYGVSCVYEGNRESSIRWMEMQAEQPKESSVVLSKLNRDGNTILLSEGFENGFPEGWNLIDANGDGRNWKLASELMGSNYSAHTGNDMMCSQSYDLSTGALSPDNYLVTPQVALGGTFSFWACAQDSEYGAEHFSVEVSTYNNSNPWYFVSVGEWTLTSRGQGATTGVTRSGSRSMGNWQQYTVDLSDYSEQMGYIAIRHFGCSDQFYLNIDDIELTKEPQLQLDRESEIAWSNPMDRDMYLYNDVDVTVTLNSGDSPEGVYVYFNQDWEQFQLNPLNSTLSFDLDETGYRAWDVFRKGEYYVSIYMNGYAEIHEWVSIYDETHLVYELEELMEGVSDLYVSRTGWASWNGLGNDAPHLTNHHYGAALFTDFENGLPNGWTTIDGGSPAGYGWQLGSTKFGSYGYGHEGSNDLMISQSYENTYGPITPDNYLITPQVTLGGTFSFWACAQDAYYGAEHFGVAVSTTGTEAADFTMLDEWTITNRSQGAKTDVTRSGNRAQTIWTLYSVDLSAYAGQTGYIAIRHFNCYDQYFLNIDDVELRNGNTTRHYEDIQVTLATTDGDTLYVGTTENDYMQLPTELLEEGQVYKVSVCQNYSSGLTSEVATCRWYYEPCDNLEGAIDLAGVTDTTGIVLSWTYPEVSNDTIDPTRKGNGNRDAWDLMMTFTAPEGGHYGVAYDGNNFYTSNWGYSGAAYNFYQYDLEGNMIEGFNINGCGNLRGITYDGQYFYGVANSNTIYCVDLFSHFVINTFTSEYGAMRGITYDPQRDGFWVIGNWSGNLSFIDRNGAVQFVGPAPESVSDLAYYMDEDDVEHVFCFNNASNAVEDYNITTNTLEGSVFNFNSTPDATGTSGGCTVGEYNGKVAFIGDLQQAPNLIGIYELHDATIPEPGPIGEPFAAAIFRNGEWIGYTVDPMFIDEDGTEDDEYEVRIVYGGARQCPYNNAYFSMSCPQTVLFPHEITATANPTEGGSVEGAGTYNYGDTCTLVATAAENYAFVNWTLVGEVVSNSPTFTFTVTEDASYVANFELTTITQTTNFTQGWNWWSTNVEANDLFDQLKTGLGANAQQIKSSTSFVNYYSGYWVGGLTNINNESCYLINNNNACTLEMTGMPALPANHPITINPNWNWIGYPNQGAQSVANAFSNFNPVNGDQVKSQSAFSTYYSGIWVGGLQNITPGMGLLYKSNNTETAILIYPEVSRSEEIVENVTADNNHWVPDMHAYPNNMTVMAVVELDDEELSGENYELAAFANGECRGSARLMYVAPLNRHIAFLTVTGDEAAELSFSLFDSETGMEYFESNNALTYTTDATVGDLDEPLVVRFRGTTGLSDIEGNLHVYPNPVKAGERFSIALPASSKVERVEIVNVLGAVVSVETSTKAPASILAPNTPGVYTLRVTVEGKGMYSRKLVVK